MLNKNLAIMDMALPIGNLDAYIVRANQIPVLTWQEEQELAQRFYQHNDLDAARRLVWAHLRFVVKIARGYAGYGLLEADLVQEGNVGLMKAVKRFNPNLGVRLVTFAVHWIKAEIHEFIIRNWRIVKIATTKAQRKLFFNLRSAKKRLGWFNQNEINEVAEDLGVSPKDIVEMESRLYAADPAFDGGHDEEDENNSPSTYLANEDANPAELIEMSDWSEQYQDKLLIALQSLDERSYEILKARWLNTKKATLHELAYRYNVSAERIRQLEQNAIKKLKAALLDADLVVA